MEQVTNHQLGRLHIAVPSAMAAEDARLVSHLAELVNDVYVNDEGDLWDQTKSPFKRTNVVEIRQHIAAGELAIVWRVDADTVSAVGDGYPPQSSSCVGCVRLCWVDAHTGDIGMLVCHESLRGLGMGRDLMHFSEEWFRQKGATAVQVELLVPDTWSHPSKVRLEAWYTRLGYELVRMDIVESLYPHLAPLLAGPTQFKIWQKKL